MALDEKRAEYEREKQEERAGILSLGAPAFSYNRARNILLLEDALASWFSYCLDRVGIL